MNAHGNRPFLVFLLCAAGSVLIPILTITGMVFHRPPPEPFRGATRIVYVEILMMGASAGFVASVMSLRGITRSCTDLQAVILGLSGLIGLLFNVTLFVLFATILYDELLWSR